MQEFFERLKLEREDLQEDLKGLELNLAECKLGDFGCGWGYTTLSLMLESRASKCIGVDKFIEDTLFDVPSIDDVQDLFNKVKDKILSETDVSPEDNLRGDVRQQLFNLLDKRSFPIFQVGDIVTGANLPSDFDFVYCKKVLQNVYNGGYGNSLKDEEGVNLAINHLAGVVKHGGLICAVEPAGINFIPFFERVGLDLVRCCRIHRGDINGQKRVTLYKSQYLIYVYAKP